MVHETSPERGAEACARAAVAAGADLIIASGGDGTVSAVAAALIGTEARLGIIPRGTANSFAAALGIPDALDGALEVLAAGHVRVIDTARIGDRIMVLHATAGLHADTIRGTPRDAKNRWGVLAYIRSGLRELIGVEPFEVELETDQHVIRCTAIAVAVANLAPTKTVLAQGPASVVSDDALLDVTVVSATSLVEAVATGIHLLRTAFQQEAATRDNVGYFACRRVRITTTPVQHLLIDGEDAGKTPVTIECIPHSLRVVAPPAEIQDRHPDAKLIGLPDLEVERKPR
jgi:YegS/Rv2252/BmrU family lipid kinase